MKRKETKKSKKDDWDDGRTIAPMDAEWMPWNRGSFPRVPQKDRGTVHAGEKGETDSSEPAKRQEKEVFSRRERRAMLLGAFRAALPYLGVLVLFIAVLYLVARVWLG